MESSLRHVVCGFALAAVLFASSASAQYQRYQPPSGVTGESWHLEFEFGTWSPAPELNVTTGSGVLAGSAISAPDDLGMPKQLLKNFTLVVRPAKKHKFRFDFEPATYSSTTVLTRALAFGGETFPNGTTVATTVDWKSYRFAYEYDFIYRPRVFAGFILETRYDNVGVGLASQAAAAGSRVKTPFPGLGGIFQIYPLSDVSLTVQFTGMTFPVRWRPITGYNGHVTDFDFYATFNFTKYLGVRSGYRTFKAFYQWDNGQDDLNRHGPYVMGVVRF
jgi:hypothetical protein